MPYPWKNLDLQEIYIAITTGGIPPAAGGATSANQTTQIAAADAANVLLGTINTSNANNLINLNELNVRLQYFIENQLAGNITVDKVQGDTSNDLQDALADFMSTNPTFKILNTFIMYDTANSKFVAFIYYR